MTSDDLVAAGDRWIPQAEYDLILARVPILCVDLILLSRDQPSKVGLIERETFDGGKGWCLVGGAVLRDEALTAAVERHLHATLGNEVGVDLGTLRMVDVIEYFTKPGMGEFCDPRKHAVSLTYAGRCDGSAQVEAEGEAFGFEWFAQDELNTLEFGFGQGAIIRRFLSRSATGGV
jgi:ADP-ribose pyrophosphatase YjhB (NUDIX family)